MAMALKVAKASGAAPDDLKFLWRQIVSAAPQLIEARPQESKQPKK